MWRLHDPNAGFEARKAPKSRHPRKRDAIPVDPSKGGRTMIAIKRAYDPPSVEDGERVLVDRLWPRGMKKEALELDGWVKDVAPSPALRAWFGHDPARWEEFRKRYQEELSDPARQEALAELSGLGKGGKLTLVYAARDEAHNHATVLRDYLARRAGRR